jgi:hypothetical protein
MTTSAARLAFAALAPLALAASLAACSSSEGTGGAGGASDAGTSVADGGGTSGPFARFCTGKTLRAIRQMNASNPGAWSTSNTQFPVGTEFFVGVASSGGFTGFVLANGVATQLDSGVGSGLTVGTDFSSDCVTAPATASKVFTVLEDSMFYADKPKTGAPCTLTAGTTFDDYGFSGGVPASLSGTKMSASCGFSPGYTSDLVYGMLVSR